MGDVSHSSFPSNELAGAAGASVVHDGIKSSRGAESCLAGILVSPTDSWTKVVLLAKLMSLEEGDSL